MKSEVMFSLFRDIPVEVSRAAQPCISVSERGTVYMNRVLLHKVGRQRAFRTQIYPDGCWLALFPQQEANVAFSEKRAHANLPRLAQLLREQGFSFPVTYDVEWDEEHQAWLGCCREMAAPPSIERLKRGRKPARRAAGRAQ